MHQANRPGRRNLLADEEYRGTGRPRAAAGTRAARGDAAGRGTVEARLGQLRRQAGELSVHIDSLAHAVTRAGDDDVMAHLEYLIQLKARRLAELSDQTAELERALSTARADGPRPAPAPHLLPEPGDGTGRPAPGSAAGRPARRTEQLITHGRSSHSPRLSRPRVVIVAVAGAVAAVLLAAVLAPGGASWPASVSTVRTEADKACQNPNLESEPDQVNFACAKPTRRILWVFALLTSDDNPHFADSRTHRHGLEPIQPAQGGEIAWSLNLHHPYNPDDPIDSIEVAARAINNIVGGATLTGADGGPVVQPGLESDPANCRRYTGSAAVTSHDGFPGRCARPVTSPAGQAAIVADVYKRWVVGATGQAARDAAILYKNAGNPGDPQVQEILKQLQSPALRA